MTTEKIKELLLQREETLRSIRQKVILLQEELQQLERNNEMLCAAAMPAWKGTQELVNQTRLCDNGDILIKYYKKVKERKEEIQTQIWKLAEEEASIQRIWCCFQILQEPYYSILYNLYVRKELYHTAELTYGYSHRTFEKRRKKGLQIIQQMYESNASNMELIHQMSL